MNAKDRLRVTALVAQAGQVTETRRILKEMVEKTDYWDLHLAALQYSRRVSRGEGDRAGP